MNDFFGDKHEQIITVSVNVYAPTRIPNNFAITSIGCAHLNTDGERLFYCNQVTAGRWANGSKHVEPLKHQVHAGSQFIQGTDRRRLEIKLAPQPWPDELPVVGFPPTISRAESLNRAPSLPRLKAAPAAFAAIHTSIIHHCWVLRNESLERQEKLQTALAEGLSSRAMIAAGREPRERHACPSCGAEHQVKS